MKVNRQNIILNWKDHLGILTKLKNIVKRMTYSNAIQVQNELALDKMEKRVSA